MPDDQSQEDLSQKKSELMNLIDNYKEKMKGRRLRHGFMNTSLIVASILVSGAITIAGIFNQGTTAAILGVLLSALLGLQQVFPFGDMAFFYRCGIADLENLQTSLELSSPSQQEIDKTIERFKVIRKNLAEGIPRGLQVMNTVMTMREEIQRIK